MISLPQGFQIGSTDAIDSRLIFTKADMLSINDAIMPEVYFTICPDDNNIYVYDKDNELDEELGRFRLYNPEDDSDSEPIDIEQIQSLFSKGETE